MYTQRFVKQWLGGDTGSVLLAVIRIRKAGRKPRRSVSFFPGIRVSRLTLFLETTGLRVGDTDDRQEFMPGGQRRPVCVGAGAAGVDLLAHQARVVHGKMGGHG